ncbi:homoserine dehydrogenase [Veillonella caviae]|uniref:homoserine dehydrogenase n=1 Tax=Veillonella caviae TaxID=248316 RepID=UPI0023F7FABB|nr:homoserine dehydrogenase [Veillonella caviae]
MKTVKIALLGFGTVSQGTFNLLRDNAELIINRSDVHIEISKIFVRNPDKYKDITLPGTAQYVTDIQDVLTDNSISIVVELMGGTTFAKECVEAALKHKKSVVTANKDLLAESGPYLLDLAHKNGVDIRFEASVLGGIPIIKTLYDSLGGNRITELVGIMNGTTNFILSKMTDEGLSYNDVLKEAQALGYAEADPTADVEGLDAARKLAILASISFNRRIFFEDVSVEGITKIDTEDIDFGKEFGYNIKLIGIAKETNKGLSLNVYPAFVPLTHPLASVRGSYNAIYIKGNGIDDAMFYGRGAGSLPTGSSVVSDIMEVAKNIAFDSTGRFKPFYFDQKNIYAPGKIESSYYIRLAVDNKTGVLAKIAAKMAEQKISVLSIVQRNMDPETAVLAIVTSKCPRSYILNLIDSFNSLRSVQEVNSNYRRTGTAAT